MLNGSVCIFLQHSELGCVCSVWNTEPGTKGSRGKASVCLMKIWVYEEDL